MRVGTHVAFALFLGFAVFAYVGNDTLASVAVFFHLFPLIDIGLKRCCNGEPFHSAFGFVVALLVTNWYESLYLPMFFLGYLTHLGLDLLDPEGLELGWPLWEQKQRYVVKGAERIIWYGSLIGIILILLS